MGYRNLMTLLLLTEFKHVQVYNTKNRGNVVSLYIESETLNLVDA